MNHTVFPLHRSPGPTQVGVYLWVNRLASLDKLAGLLLPTIATVLQLQHLLREHQMKYVLALILALSAAPAFAQSSWSDYGNQSYGQINGQSFNANRIGSQTYGRIGNDSFSTSRIGNQTIGRIGNQNFNHNQIGNQGYGRIGNDSYSTTRIGNQTIINGSNGRTTCTRIGSQMICN